VASSFGVEIIDRPTEIARDDSPIEASLRHAIKHLAEADRFVTDIVVLMQANVPIRKPGMVDRVIQMLIDTKDADSAASVFEVDQWPQWMKLKNDKGFRRQDLEKPYLLDGAVMAIRRSVLDATPDISGLHQYLGGNVVAVVQEKEYSIEIDEERDLLFAESVMQYIA
jgi:N-acylneuraminate cytidylyltransferase